MEFNEMVAEESCRLKEFPKYAAGPVMPEWISNVADGAWSKGTAELRDEMSVLEQHLQT